ncbi:hypothetical protein [Streptomyces sp. SAI-218]|uniref:hypothetical protein n=1 Tax=Streptomyces sp. SAI-218 TaxID=3377736 RepID=UPI003C797AFA
MPTVSRTAPAVLAAALLLTACGNQSASSGSDEDGGGPVKAEALCPSDFSRYGSPPSSEPSVRPSGTRTALPLPSAGGDGTAGNGVEITALYAWGPQSGCTGVGYSADFEITNQQTHTATYTLTFGFLSASGGAVDNVEHTVEAIAPGRAVKGTVVMGEGDRARAGSDRGEGDQGTERSRSRGIVCLWRVPGIGHAPLRR